MLVSSALIATFLGLPPRQGCDINIYKLESTTSVGIEYDQKAGDHFDLGKSECINSEYLTIRFIGENDSTELHLKAHRDAFKRYFYHNSVQNYGVFFADSRGFTGLFRLGHTAITLVGNQQGDIISYYEKSLRDIASEHYDVVAINESPTETDENRPSSVKQRSVEKIGDPIDVLVVFDSRLPFATFPLVDQYAEAQIAATNVIYEETQIGTRLRLAGAVIAKDVPQTPMWEKMQSLVSTNDGRLDTIHRVRVATGADIVVLITERDVGVAGLARTLNPGFGDAFAIVGVPSEPSTFAHEVGHLLGADHDPPNACSSPQIHCLPASEAFARSYAHGFIREMGWREHPPYGTVMAYLGASSVCPNCVRREIFSNPRVPDGRGWPSGSYHTHDNARVISEQTPVVAGLNHPLPAGHTIFPRGGLWHNPERSGHGMSLSYGDGGRLIAFWYTYESGGTPVWYVSEAVRPFGRRWSSTLYKAQYRHSLELHPVGSLDFFFISDREALASWYGATQTIGEGREYITYFFGNSSIGGAYFDPAEPGWGFTLDAQGNDGVVTIFGYDGTGEPRWVQGSFGSMASFYNTASLRSFLTVGLCPTCFAGGTSMTSESAGSAGLWLGDAVEGWINVSGRWSWVRGAPNRPIEFARLTSY